jgi:hypothetical protein
MLVALAEGLDMFRLGTIAAGGTRTQRDEMAEGF